MRRVLALLPVSVVLAAVAGCGTSHAHVSYASVLAQTAAKTTQSGSSRMTLSTDTLVSGQHVTFSGTGAFAYTRQEGQMTLTIGAIPGVSGALTMSELLTGGSLYLQLPGQSAYYRLRLTDLVGTQLAQSSDPASALSTLAGVSGPITTLGTESVRGTSTTHVSGTLDLRKALAKLSGALKAFVQGTLAKAAVTSVPFDAYLDGDGRLRKLVEHLTLTVKGQTVAVTTTMEFYDFGTKVSVTPPPADQVRDGAAILAALKAAG